MPAIRQLFAKFVVMGFAGGLGWVLGIWGCFYDNPIKQVMKSGIRLVSILSVFGAINWKDYNFIREKYSFLKQVSVGGDYKCQAGQYLFLSK